MPPLSILKSGELQRPKGRRSLICDLQIEMPFPQWAVGSGQWAVGSGQWAVGSGQWAVGSGQWAVGSGQWAVGSGQWAVGSGQWAVGSGILILVFRAGSSQPIPSFELLFF